VSRHSHLLRRWGSWLVTRYVHDPARHADRNRSRRHITQYHGVGSDPGVVTDANRPKDLGTSAYIDVSPQLRYSLAVAPKCNLVKDKAIRPDRDTGMDYNAIRMGNDEPSAQLAIQRDVRAGHNTPKPVLDHVNSL